MHFYMCKPGQTTCHQVFKLSNPASVEFKLRQQMRKEFKWGNLDHIMVFAFHYVKEEFRLSLVHITLYVSQKSQYYEPKRGFYVVI